MYLKVKFVVALFSYEKDSVHYFYGGDMSILNNNLEFILLKMFLKNTFFLHLN